MDNRARENCHQILNHSFQTGLSEFAAMLRRDISQKVPIFQANIQWPADIK